MVTCRLHVKHTYFVCIVQMRNQFKFLPTTIDGVLVLILISQLSTSILNFWWRSINVFTNQLDFVMIAFWFESYVNVVTDLSVWYNIGDGDESGIGLVASRFLVYCVSGNYHINVCMCSCDIVLFFILHFSNHLWTVYISKLL